MCRVLSSRTLTWTEEARTKLAKPELQKAWADLQLPDYINRNIAMKKGIHLAAMRVAARMPSPSSSKVNRQSYIETPHAWAAPKGA